MKQVIFTITLLLYFFGWLLANPIVADYVLPYPSYMPGNKLYRVSLIFDKLEAFWYFGNIASIKYHLKLADKYLVEAKTLFEYNQYLLAVNALGRSDQQFSLVPQYLENALHEGKDVTNLRKTVKQAAAKHEEILQKLKDVLPKEFTWVPEKQAAQALRLEQLISESINVRGLVINK